MMPANTPATLYSTRYDESWTARRKRLLAWERHATVERTRAQRYYRMVPVICIQSARCLPGRVPRENIHPGPTCCLWQKPTLVFATLHLLSFYYFLLFFHSPFWRGIIPYVFTIYAHLYMCCYRQLREHKQWSFNALPGKTQGKISVLMLDEYSPVVAWASPHHVTWAMMMAVWRISSWPGEQ